MEAGALRAPAGLNRITVTAPLLRLRSDDQLVALFREGNDAAFNVIHDRYRQRLFAYSRQMLGGSRQDAEDALQDVFLRAYSSLRANDRPVSLRAWLYRVAHNRCIDHLRKPAPPAADLFAVSRKPLHDPIVEAERREDLRRLVEDLRRLPEQQRSALLMREIDGLSYGEVGDALGVTLPAVKSLLVRARIGLVEAIEARDTACVQIRTDLADAQDRRVRASSRARRHVRDCQGCTEYRAQLRGVSTALGALAPSSPGMLAAVAKALGIGGAGSGAAASAGGGAATVAGGGAVTTVAGTTATKLAAIVCGAALTAGGAVEVRERIAEPSRSGAAERSAPSGAARSVAQSPAPTVALPVPARRSGAPVADPRRKRARSPAEGAAGSAPVLPGADDVVISPHTLTPSEVARGTDTTTGGATAPDEEEGFGQGVQGLQPKAQPEPQRQGLLGALLGDGSSPQSSQQAPQRGTPEAETSPPPAGEPGAEKSATADGAGTGG